MWLAVLSETPLQHSCEFVRWLKGFNELRVYYRCWHILGQFALHCINDVYKLNASQSLRYIENTWIRFVSLFSRKLWINKHFSSFWAYLSWHSLEQVAVPQAEQTVLVGFSMKGAPHGHFNLVKSSKTGMPRLNLSLTSFLGGSILSKIVDPPSIY